MLKVPWLLWIAEQLETSLNNFKADKSGWPQIVCDKTYSGSDKCDLSIKAVTPHDSLYGGVTTPKTVEATVTSMTGEHTINFDRFCNVI